jgi:hypothetical protein
MSDYDPIECLRQEVKRFKDTNQFSPLLVTNFYVQATVVLNRYDMLESENTRLKARVKELEELAKAEMERGADLFKENADLRLLVRASCSNRIVCGSADRGFWLFFNSEHSHDIQVELKDGTPILTPEVREALTKALK